MLLCLLLAASLLFGCGHVPEEKAAPDYQIGIVLIGDENNCYSNAHVLGIRNACEALGLKEEENILIMYSVPGDDSCYRAIVSCIEQGCSLVFTDDASHERYTIQAASEYPEFQFVAIGGSSAATRGLANFHNASTKSQDSYYAAGLVAGRKLTALEEEDAIPEECFAEDGTIRIGFVGLSACTEIISDYTAFYLGVRAVEKNVSMLVQYTNSRNNPEEEYAAAMSLIERGCVILAQHTDSTAVCDACQQALDAGMCVFSVGSNFEQPESAPDAFLISPIDDWTSYYTAVFTAFLNAEAFDTDWCGGFAEDAIRLSTPGEACAEGPLEAAAQSIAKLRDNRFHVFATAKFTVKGEAVESAFVTDSDGDGIYDADEAVFDGYFHERYFSSAAAFDLRIDGISELN